MPTKMVTLVCGLACGFGLALALPAAGNRDAASDIAADRPDRDASENMDGRPRKQREQAARNSQRDQRPGNRERREMSESRPRREPRPQREARDRGSRRDDRMASGRRDRHERRREFDRPDHRSRDSWRQHVSRVDRHRPHHRGRERGRDMDFAGYRGQHHRQFDWRDHRGPAAHRFHGPHHGMATGPRHFDRERFAGLTHRHRDSHRGWHDRSHFGRHGNAGYANRWGLQRGFRAHQRFPGHDFARFAQRDRRHWPSQGWGRDFPNRHQIGHSSMRFARRPGGFSQARSRHRSPSIDGIFERFDQDKNGSLSKTDVPEPVWNRLSKADANHDGSVTREELGDRLKSLRGQRRARPTESKPVEKPNEEKPAEGKPQDPTGSVDGPADATAVANATN